MVRMFLAIAWLLFVLALGLASFAALLLNFHRNAIRQGLAGKKRDFQFAVLGISFVLEVLQFGAFFFLSLSLVSYSRVVGWIAVGFSGVFACAGLIFWVAKKFSPEF
ncbi:hypothetical protein B0O99DRAFT_675167 [Bisporella sp. PMI_857]|nr:hypothetical protein B0O99DRAFT_675167 [Bisporella sp. PMI_857]